MSGLLYEELAAALDAEVAGRVLFDSGARATYSTDASNYRQVPIGVVEPVSVDDAVAAIAVCRRFDVPVLSRGGGTSLAGQCCNTAVVLDWSRHCTAVVSVDTEVGRAVVEPGIALDRLNDRLAAQGWQVGPRPSTHVSCTIGGMIGNNSCGATAQAYGKMVDSVRRLEVVTYDGERMWVGATSDADFARIDAQGGRRAQIYRGLREIARAHGDRIRAGYPDIPRRVSGYNLDDLLPERGFHLAKALVGSEGTLVSVLRAEIDLVAVPVATTMVVLGYPDVCAAADAVPAIGLHRPSALEGIDRRLIGPAHGRHLAGQLRERLPDGDAWLIVQLDADTDDAAADKAAHLLAALGRRDGVDAWIVADAAQRKQMWAVREAGVGAAAYPSDGPETHPGWEDAAVSPDRLGDYLRDFARLLDRYDYGSAALYGHFGHGCVHTRIPFDLRSADGIARFRRFVEDAARLVANYGGSLSGEHGDGHARAELLPIMFGPRIVEVFEQVKTLFDPTDRMNPGKIVRPHRLDEDLRQGADFRPWQPATEFGYPDDGGSFAEAVGRCVGVGKCRGHESGVMCPSYRVTGAEEHSTRGRSRLLFEMMEGEVITDGWRSTEVRDALDLCLSCKGCKSDCPVDVDMATYKAEFLFHHYRRRIRPRAHYSMGWLPVWARLAAVAPQAVNALARVPGLGAAGKKIAGVDRRREVPTFARRRFSDRFSPPSTGGTPVLLWPDTFTDNFDPHIADAAVEVLTAAGFDVTIPASRQCCGLTWISTGQLRRAKKVLRSTLEALRPWLRAGTPIVVLEPSCAAVFRSDIVDLLPGDQDARRLAQQTHTIGELLARYAPDWAPPGEADAASALVQQHCHQHAIFGYDRDERALWVAGVEAEVLDAGCCGLAGNFGFESGHYEVSIAVAEDKMMPAVRGRDRATEVVADGFSCRTQITHLQPDVRPRHTVEVLADRIIQVADDRGRIR